MKIDEARTPAGPGYRFAYIGESFSKTALLSARDISSFATFCDDLNPLHHDQDFALASRFGGLIACGSHPASLLMGLLATHFSAKGSMVGVEFVLRFHGPTRPDQELTLRWSVRDIAPNRKLMGELISLEGLVADTSGTRLISCDGKVIVSSGL